MNFDDSREKKHLQSPGSSLSSSFLKTSIACAQSCNRHPKCRSVNFCLKRSCKLNLEDVFSTDLGSSVLLEEKNCVYYGMKQSTTHVCAEVDEGGKILHGSLGNTCPVTMKQVDAKWSDWAQFKIDNQLEFKQSQNRTLILDAAHGGQSGELEVITDWLKFISEKSSWAQARDNCVSLGGRLFSKLDGTEAQARFLFEKSGREPSWSGYIKNYEQGVNSFVTVDGDRVPNDVFHWGPGELTSAHEKYVAIGWAGEYYQVDVPDEYTLRSICDLA